MPPPKPQPKRDALEQQDQSIKNRKSQLFDGPGPEDTPTGEAVGPFSEYLHKTPADPLSTGWKAGLWGLTILVGVLFLAALLKGKAPGPSEKPPAEEPGSAVPDRPA